MAGGVWGERTSRRRRRRRFVEARHIRGVEPSSAEGFKEGRQGHPAKNDEFSGRGGLAVGEGGMESSPVAGFSAP